MNQFTFESRQKSVLIGLMVLGVICMGITFATDDAYHTRFWTNFLHNSVFFTGIAFLALFLLSAKAVAYSGWQTVFKRVWEAFSQFLIVGLVLMLVLVGGVWLHYHHLYHWADAEAVANDVTLKGKSGFLNPFWYSVATIGVLGVWYTFARKFRSLSLAQDAASKDDKTYPYYLSMKTWGAVFLPLGGFSSAAVIWFWIMSVDAHWYSTMFAWYTTASWLVSMIASTILLLIYLKSKGYYEEVTTEHLHDLGKYLFGFSVFWTYLWFSQFMLIWYANIGEETVYFDLRMSHYPVLFFGNLVLNFVLPFLILIRNDTKRKYGSLIFVSSLVLFGHWIDFFQMTKFGPLHTAMEKLKESGKGAEHLGFMAGFSIPGLLEIGTMLGFVGLFLFFVFSQLEKASLVPENDPYLAESLHHHV